MPSYRKTLFSLALITSIATAGCDIESDCSDVGCDNGLQIRVVTATGVPVTTYDMTVTVETSSTTVVCPFVFNDDDASPCPEDGVFIRTEGLPASVQVDITSPDGAFNGVIAPTYEDQFPNGEDCGAVCARAFPNVELE